MQPNVRVLFLATAVATCTGSVSAWAVPAPTSISPAVVTPGQTVTVLGTGLLSSGTTVTIGYRKKYLAAGEVPTASVSPLSATAGAVTFAAPANAVPNSFQLRYRQNLVKGGTSLVPQLDTYTIPGTLHVKEPPTITGANGIITLLSDGQRGMQLDPGAGRSFEVRGRNLVPAPGTSVTFAIGRTDYSASTARYDTSANGRDLLTIDVPEPEASFRATARVTTSAGAATAENWTVSRRIRFTAIEEIDATGALVGPANGKMLRGRRYRVRGSDFGFPPSPPFESSSRVRVNGSVLNSDSMASPTRHIFVFPTSFTGNTASLSLRGFGGDLELGTFNVTDPGTPAPSLAGFVVSPSPTVQGSLLSAVVSFAGSISPGADVGGVEISSSDNSRMVGLPRIVPITSNPMTIPLQTYARDRNETRTITARLTRLTGGSDQLTASAQLTAPQFTGPSLLEPSVPGGTIATLRVTFDFPEGAPVRCGNALTGPDIEVTVNSSDPAVSLADPELFGNRVCVERSVFDIDLVTPPVTSTREVVLTVGYGSVSRTARLSLTPPVVSIALNRSALTSMQSATGTLSLSSPMSGTFALVSSSDPAVSVPAKMTFGTSSSLTFPVTTLPVATARSVTLSAIVNGVTRSTTLSLNPLAFESLSLTSPSVRAGTNVAATLLLNANIDLPFTATLTTSNPAVATVPPSVPFSVGQNAAVFSVQSIGPQTANRQATITAAYTVTLPNGSQVTTSKSTVLTVTP